jgi:hypothetical protein
MLLNVTVTLLIVPPIPVTLIADGYGVAFPTFGIVTTAVLVNDRVPVKGVLTVT